MNIIHHGERIDIESLINRMCCKYVSVDMRDYSHFISKGNEIHSFIAKASGYDRIKRAFDIIFSIKGSMDIITYAEAFMIIIICSTDSKTPLSVKEVQPLFDIINKHMTGKDFIWGMAEDTITDDNIKVILLSNLNK